MRPRRRRKSTAGGAGRRRIAAPLVALLCLCADPRRGASAADRGVSEEERERVRQWQRRMAAEDAAFGRRREGRRGRPGGPAPPPAPEPSEEGGDDQDGNPLSGLSIFSTRRPRDALEGLRSGLVNGLAGAVYGLAAFVAGPVAGFGAGGAAGGLGGLLAGTVLGALLPLAGLVSGAVQLVRGLAATPAAVRDGFWRCMVYDEEEREWRVYNLDDDVADIEAGLRAEKKKGGGAAGGAGRAGGRRVRSAEYYELLGVRTDATTSEIRSAYRRGARDVHPDKNKGASVIRDGASCDVRVPRIPRPRGALRRPERSCRHPSPANGSLSRERNSIVIAFPPAQTTPRPRPSSGCSGEANGNSPGHLQPERKSNSPALPPPFADGTARRTRPSRTPTGGGGTTRPASGSTPRDPTAAPTAPCWTPSCSSRSCSGATSSSRTWATWGWPRRSTRS